MVCSIGSCSVPASTRWRSAPSSCASSRTLTDLAKARTDEALFPPDVTELLQELFGRLAEAIESFAVLVTTQLAADADAAEERLADALARSRATRDLVADLLLEDVQEHPRQWQLHGALLAEIDRVLDELDIEERTKRLGEELDRRSAEAHARRPRLRALARHLGRQPA